MARFALQISSQAQAAYFKSFIEVALQELHFSFGDLNAEHRPIGPFNFLWVEATEDQIPKLARLSFVQGCYRIHDNHLEPLVQTGDFSLHEDFVFGSKYKGKTSERLTQLLINVGMAALGNPTPKKMKLLDPMCGRGTTLFWAARYGMKARGIEQDAQALEDIRRNFKKWTKIHKVKHTLKDGFVGKANKKNQGKFLELNVADTHLKFVIGDARDVQASLKEETFNFIISDLPYGVQHFTTDKTRNPLDVIQESLESWKQCLKPGGVVVLAFNSNIPKRDALVGVFTDAGFTTLDFAAAHRMSESIVRDVVVFQKSEA
jgi:SAM-dependent methyltransferase